MKNFLLQRIGGQWVLRESGTGIDRPFGMCTKEEAMRRAANFLKGRNGRSSLTIYSTKGGMQSERIYEGRRDSA